MAMRYLDSWKINGPGSLLFISPVGLDGRPRGARGLITITQISSDEVTSSDLQASNGGSGDVQEGSTQQRSRD